MELKKIGNPFKKMFCTNIIIIAQCGCSHTYFSSNGFMHFQQGQISDSHGLCTSLQSECQSFISVWWYLSSPRMMLGSRETENGGRVALFVLRMILPKDLTVALLPTGCTLITPNVVLNTFPQGKGKLVQREVPRFHSALKYYENITLFFFYNLVAFHVATMSYCFSHSGFSSGLA